MKTPDSAIAWINVKARRDPASIIASIKAGLFYATTGPRLKSVTFDGDAIVAETSPAASIGFVSSPSRGTKYCAIDKPLTEATYTPRKHETYIRVEATDEAGRTAYSNPIYITE